MISKERDKTIEVRGAGFSNKGAELMFLSVIQYFKLNYPSIELAINLRRGSFRKRKELGIKHLIWFETRKLPMLSWKLAILLNKVMRILPEILLRYCNLVLDNETSAILDISGFAYSDQIGLAKVRLMARKTDKAKQEGKKIILLPQAFGPFESEKTRDYMRKIIENADLIFARDIVSYDCIKDLSYDHQKLHLAPDFTNLLDGKKPITFSSEGRIAIIPNTQIIERTPERMRSSYVPFLCKCIEFYQRKNLNPFILLHELDRDVELANRIKVTLESSIDIVNIKDPLMIKGVISECEGVVSSRYHGLISALSQGVPVLAVGWSHKYRELMSDYNILEGFIKDISNEQHYLPYLELLGEKRSRKKMKNRVVIASEKQKEKTLRMWNNIQKTLNYEVHYIK